MSNSNTLAAEGQKGKVKFFNQKKGYGFIEKEEGGDVFVHVTGCEEKIEEGDQVTFQVSDGKKGKIAVGVRRI